ncbi:MAG: ATP-dependent zinc protease [Gammaproteobacteria bacterium]|nr:MAG: ATP-dependent zinc protease [Gammaproteobacteria bacterium]
MSRHSPAHDQFADCGPRALRLGAGALILWATILFRPAVAETAPADKQILGWVERVLVSSERVSMKAKLDTGAKTSSLHAANIERFKRDDQRMVRFDIEDPENGNRLTLERPLVRSVRIKEQDTDGSTSRPVVMLSVCIGQTAREVEVNLVDRSRFIYPFLIGRSALAGQVVVDPDDTFTQPPVCSVSGAES